MTDEEIAEEWCKENMDCIKTVSFLNHDCNYFSDEARSVAKSAFLTGLKAGRLKWHKVADGDLPSEEGGWVCNQDGLPCYYDWGTEQWLDCEGTQIRTSAWCDMQRFEEE